MAAATSKSKNKKDKKKGKSVASHETTSIEQDLSFDNKTNGVDATCKTKEVKEKKNKADKKKATCMDVNTTTKVNLGNRI